MPPSRPTLLAGAVLGLLAVGPASAQTAPPAPVRSQPRPAQPVPGATPVAPPADRPATPLDVTLRGADTLNRHLAAAQPTIFVFTRPASRLERMFLDEVCKDAGRKAGVRVVKLSSGAEAVAQKYEVKETPTALVFDRRGRLVSRSSDPAEIRASLQKALGVARIDWPEGADPRVAESEKLLGRPITGGILRTMTFQPEWLSYINDLSRRSHFSPGYLDVRTKEMIAAYVSALNECRF